MTNDVRAVPLSCVSCTLSSLSFRGFFGVFLKYIHIVFPGVSVLSHSVFQAPRGRGDKAGKL